MRRRRTIANRDVDRAYGARAFASPRGTFFIRASPPRFRPLRRHAREYEGLVRLITVDFTLVIISIELVIPWLPMPLSLTPWNGK